VHHDDAVGHGHGLDLVVRDVDRGRLQALVQRLDLGAHRHAQLGVQVGQRLVEQEDLGVAHDGAAHGHALALAAGEFARVAVEQRVEVEDARRLVHAARGLAASALRRRSEKPMFSRTVMCGYSA
jgi:malonyl CoA-acyl carrier protein transacylase